MGMSSEVQNALSNPTPPVAAINDIQAKGTEFELNFNPTRYWTLTGSVTDSQTSTTNVSGTLAAWIAQRMAIWTTIKDPTIPITTDPTQSWWNHNYGGSQTAAQNYATFVGAPYSIVLQREGKSNPQVRRYNARVSTNLRLSGLTENKVLKHVNVGGAIRWEDKGAIGYYGVQQLPATITDLDANRPIYDHGHYYFDAFIGYRTRLWGDRIAATFQLNVQNLQESGRFQAIGAFPDGTPNAYRIVDPRKFILQATFDL
jgi:hypothetical protein